MCVIGKRFSCNIMHEPGYFARISDEFQHYIVFKVKPYKYKENKKKWSLFFTYLIHFSIRYGIYENKG